MSNRAALYFHSPGQGQTLSKLTDYLEIYCHSNGLEVVETYQDVGSKGAGAAKAFPAFKQMVKDAKAGTFDVAVFERIEALGPSVSHMIKHMDAIHRSRVSVVFVKDGIDTSTLKGQAMLDMVTKLAAIDKAQTRDRVKAGLARRKAEGLNVGRPTISPVKEMQIRLLREEGIGILKIAAKVGCGVSAVQRVIREMDELPPTAPAAQPKAATEEDDERQLDLGW